ncbi:MAG: hypothetical protein V4505_25600 [Pseudomonadota bacterium]
MPVTTIANAALGWNADSTPEELAPGQWSDVRNMRFRDGYAERVKGMAQIFATPSITPYSVGPYGTTTARFWFHAGLQRVFVDDGATRTDITPYTPLPTISTITASTTTATMTFASAHGRTTGDTVVVDGATPAAYNGTFVVTVTGATTLTYTTLTAPGGSATVVGLAWLAVVQLLTGGVDDRWTGGVFNGVLVLNNGVDVPMYWGGDVTKKLRMLPGWDTTHRAAVIRPFKTHLIALDITKGVGTTPVRYPNMLKGSWAAIPGAVPPGWDTSNAGQDGIERDLAETADLMVDCKAYGDTLIVYKGLTAYAVRESFTNTIYNSQRIQGSQGMLTRGCVAETPKGHVVLTNGDLVLHQGGAPTSLAEGRIKRYLFNTMDPAKRARAFVVVNPKCKEVWVCFASRYSDSCDTAVTWNWDADTFGHRSLPGVTYGASGQIAQVLGGDTYATNTTRYIDNVRAYNEVEYSPSEDLLLLSRALPMITLAEVGGTDAGTLLTDYLERRGMPMGDGRMQKAISIVNPRASAISGTLLGVSVGAAKNADQAPSYMPAATFVIGQQQEVTQTSDNGGFLALRFSRSAVDPSPIQPYRLRSLDIEYMNLGRN